MNSKRNTTSKSMSTEKSKTSNKDINSELWTNGEREKLKSLYRCEIIQENCSPLDLKNTNLPYDTYIVTYFIDDRVYYDLTRATKKSDIFDMYWDKFRKDLKGIRFGYGKINPKLWGYKSPEKKKRK